MRKTTLIVAAVMLFNVLTASVVFSQQITDALRLSRQGLHFNARALSLGNAYSTIGYDFSALRFNPATMAVSDKFSFTMSLNANAFKSNADYYGNRVPFTTTSTTGSQAGLIFPLRLDSTRSVMVGLGYTQSKDFNLGFKFEGLNAGTRFPSFIQVFADHDDPTTRALGLSYTSYDSSGNLLGDQTTLGANLYEKGYLLDEGGMSHVSFGLSVEAAPNIFFGVSGSYNTGHYTSDLELSASDINDAYPAGVLTIPGNSQTNGFVGVDYRSVRDKQYSGWDVRFGTLFKLENFIGVSASFKVPTSHQVTEDIFIRGRSEFAGNHSIVIPETITSSTYDLKPPAEMTLGAMVNLWIITGTAQASYVDYAAMQITSGVGDLPDRTAINKRIKDELSAVVNLNLGAEFRLPFTGMSARAGGIYQPSPYKADPSRNGQKFLTAGIGINSNDVMQFDIGYAYGWRGENKNQQTGNASSAEQLTGYHTALFTMRFSK